jgi:Abnormal spindle-like microcephaly-assoc'd, ASPM-SPD-2-Hydin
MRQRFSLVSPLIVALLMVGCGGGTGPASNSSSTGNTPSLTAGSSSLNFGSVAVGSSKTITLTVTNPATSGTVNVSNVAVTGTGFSLSSAPSVPFSVAPGQTVSASIAFAPKSAGSATGSLTVTSDASDGSLSIPLLGTGTSTTSAQLSVSPATLSFGSVAIGSTQTATGTLSASGASVTVSTVDQTGQGYALSGITFPVTIAAGNSVSYTVTFAPTVAGSATGSLSFASNAANSPTSESLSGTGTGSSTQHSVALSWQASTSTVAGYNVYRGTVSGGPYTRLNSSLDSATSYTDSTVQSGTTYYYVATSVDSSDDESGYSNQISATIPTP